MFNNHQISVITDLGQLGQNIYLRDALVVAAITTTYQLPDLPTIYQAGILTPPFEMLQRWADGDQFVLMNEYPAYLQCKECDDLIIAFLAALTIKDIFLFIPPEDLNIYGKMLLDHLYFNYGITCNFMNVRFSIQQSKIPFIISKFYMNDLMTPNEYLATYPGNYSLPQFVIGKLAEDLHPFNYVAQFQDYEAYFNNLNAAKLTANKPMVRIVGDKK